MAVRIQFRRGTATEWSAANPVLAQGELGYESTNKIIKFGDGQTNWNTLAVAAAGDITKVKAGTGLRYGATTTDNGDSGVVELELDPAYSLQASVINAKGDLIVGTANDAYAIVPIGSNGQALVADSTKTAGVKWGTVTDPVISNGFITEANLASNSVTNTKLANNSVTVDKLADGSVTTAKIADNAVTTGKLSDANVTDVKLAANSVTTAKLANLAVTTDKIAASSVTAAKVSTDVYQRATSGLTSARIFISSSATAPVGAAGDIWFKY